MVGVAARTDRPIGSPTSGFARRERERTSFSPEPIAPEADGRSSGGPSLPPAQVVGVAAGAAAGSERAITLEDLAGARLLVSEVRVALLLLDEARYRVMKRLFGVSRDQSWVVTLIALAALAQATHDKSDQMLRGPGGPTRADVVLGGAALGELLAWIPGPSSRETPLVATLVTIAVAGALVRPAPSLTAHGTGRPHTERGCRSTTATVIFCPPGATDVLERRRDDRRRRGNRLIATTRHG